MAEEPDKNDIDFDELDKAVNSLMGKVGGETLEDADKTKTLDINTTLKPDEKVKYDEIGKAAEKIGGESLVTDSEVELVEDLSKLPDEMQLPVAQQPAAQITSAPTAAPAVVTASDLAPAPAMAPKPTVPRPNNGRFMDMVHPKADMLSPAPLPNLVVPNRAGAIPSPFSDTPVTVASSTSVEVASDPVEIARSPEIPVATPFLADAKVEKRPLGGMVINPITVTSSEEKVIEPLSHSGELNTEEKGEPEPVETISINSEDANKSDNGSSDEQRALNASDFGPDSTTDPVLTQIEASEATETRAEETQTIEKVESGDTESLKVVKKASQKIVVQPTTNSDDSAIYDTQDYHQPLTHPPKQKSGWGTVLIIIIVIVLAVAIAGGAYVAFGFNR